MPRHPKSPSPKRRGGSPAVRGSAADQLTRALNDALDRQAATAEILRVISDSPADPKPVFDAIVRNLKRLFGTRLAHVQIFKDGQVHLGAATEEEFDTIATLFPRPLDDNFGGGRAIMSKQLQHFVPVQGNATAPQATQRMAKELGFDAAIFAPMVRGDKVIGVICTARRDPVPFDDKQIALIKAFADQAVIAIENTRLLNELRESLERQTATGEILASITGSISDPKPVFDAIVRNLQRLFGTRLAMVQIVRDGMVHLAATTTDEEFDTMAKLFPRPLDENFAAGRAMVSKQVTQFVPVQGNPEVPAATQQFAKELGFDAAIFAPMMRGDAAIGVIATARREPKPFDDKQITLIKAFADQAVIAIENTRLLNELRESLEQQKATGEILASITGSIADTKPVFEAITRNLQRLFGAPYAMVTLLKDGALHLAAAGDKSQVERAADQYPRPATDDSAVDRAIKSRHIVQFAPVLDNPDAPPRTQHMARALGFNAQMSAPMILGDKVIGAITTARREAKAFDHKEIALIESFAAQAVIAIENTRLFDELRTKTGELQLLTEQLEKRVADQVSEIERMGRLRRFLPPQVADLIVTTGAEKQLESHRREITALFCDLRGFTGFSESADPEDVMALLQEYHAAIGKIIFKHGGTLERFVGDGVMVIFNDPIPLENPSLHAVQMALDLRAAIGALIDTWRRMGHDLGFGIGIAHGYATLGTIGFEGRYDYAAIGTVSNVASRLCDEARPGQILISPRVLTAVEGAVVVEPAGELVLKGIRRPLEVHNVVDLARRDQ